MVRARLPESAAEDPVEAEALAWLVRLRDDDPPADLEVDFKAWLDVDPAHRDAYAEAERLFDDLDQVAPPAPMMRSVPVWAGQGRVIAASMTATVVVGVVVAFGLLNPAPDLSTGVGEIRPVTLADGTTAILDAASAIDVEITPESRTITLKRGRVWFDVAHEQGRPFIVKSGSAAIRDIGTGFEVARSGRGGAVAVTEGIVELVVDDGPALRLFEGEGARFSRGSVRRIAFVSRIAAWRAGRLEFQNARLADVLKDLERYGAGRVIILDDEVGNVRLTGGFDATHPDAAQAAVLARAGASARPFGPVLLVERNRSSTAD